MTLIKSISGMRGTIGGQVAKNLTPIDIVEMTAAYGMLLLDKEDRPKMVVGRDGRISGPLVQALVINTLLMQGIDVLSLELSTTPTVEMEVVHQKAHGGIIITASHNPEQWNALKFLNAAGECINSRVGDQLLNIADNKKFAFAEVHKLGKLTFVEGALERHVEAIFKAPHVKPSLIKSRKFRVIVDAINSSGGQAMKQLLLPLDCEVIVINEKPLGAFSHNPEPLEHHLQDLIQAVIAQKADVGIAVDPDVDRLAFVDNNGRYCGEEYTLVMVADWILSLSGGNTVSNLSSTLMLRKVTEQRGGSYRASAVGEVNVVAAMKQTNAVIGGEGNGGVIYPALHYGRDALAGVALLLSALAHHNIDLSTYRDKFENYYIIKDKIELTDDTDIEQLLSTLAQKFSTNEIDTTDGVKIYFEGGWAHLRRSNTEPIIRVYAESHTIESAEKIASLIHAQL